MSVKIHPFAAALVIGGIAVVGGLAVYELTKTDPVENAINIVVARINATLGKQWGGYAVDAIKTALNNSPAAGLVALVEIVRSVENTGSRPKLTGPQKLKIAAQLVQRAGIVIS